MKPGVMVRVRQVVIDHFSATDIDRIEPTTHFFDDLRADSLDMMEVVVAIEDEFDIDLNDDAIGQIATVADVARVVNEALSSKGGD